MLTELSLSNFKALKNVDIKLGRVTVLIGENGSGKSSVLQALAMLKQSLGSSGLVTSGPRIQLGDIEDVVHGRNFQNLIQVRLRVQVPLSETGKEMLGSDVDGTYSASFQRQNLVTHGVKFTLPFKLESSFNRETGGFVIKPERITIPGRGNVIFTGNQSLGLPLTLRSLQNVTEYQSELNAALQSTLAVFTRQLENTYYVPPVRGIESPWYDQESQATDEFATVKGLPSQASSILSTLTYRKQVEAEMSRLAEQVLGLRIRTRAVEGNRVVAETHDGQTVNIVNEGYGVNQLIHVLAQAAVAEGGALLCIEEPEIHLHPAAQAALANVLADLTYDDEKQILITTHSEHILLALLTYFGSRQSASNDLRVYYFTRGKEGHVATAEPLAVDDRGRLEGGLRGFFEANIAELGDYLKALSRGTNDE